jgi:hypothetical protein
MQQYMIVTHIPRCGGSSFRYSLNEALIDNEYFHDKHKYISGFTHGNICLSERPYLIDAIHQNTVLFFDHSYAQTFERLRNLSDDKVYKILLIRDPINRFVSCLKFFYNIDLTAIDNTRAFEQIDKLIPLLQNATIKYLTHYLDPGPSTIIDIAKKQLKSYDMIIRQENPEDILTFNDTNPFSLDIKTKYHINSSHTDYESLNPDIKNTIYSYMKQDYEILEEYYSI